MPEMIEITCGGCGIEFSIPKRKYDELQDTGEEFYCPNGCSRYFADSWKTRYEKQIAKQKKEMAEMEINLDDWIELYRETCAERDHLARQKNGLYGYIAKLKKMLEVDNERSG